MNIKDNAPEELNAYSDKARNGCSAPEGIGIFSMNASK